MLSYFHYDLPAPTLSFTVGMILVEPDSRTIDDQIKSETVTFFNLHLLFFDMNKLRSVLRSMARSKLPPSMYALTVNRGRLLQMCTARLRRLPDFVIIGAQKAGTTSLYDLMTRHPSIAPAYDKELRYFSTYYDRGETWYRSNFPVVRGQLTGESTPSYVFYSAAPSRMKKLLPNARIIVILRNPVDRAYSHYNMVVRFNRVSVPFREALDLEKKAWAGEE